MKESILILVVWIASGVTYSVFHECKVPKSTSAKISSEEHSAKDHNQISYKVGNSNTSFTLTGTDENTLEVSF